MLTFSFSISYVNMGLVVTLDPSAHGGVEKPLGVRAGDSIEVEETSQIENVAGPSSAPHKTASSSKSSSVPSGFGKIIRDAEGNVLRIELPTEEEIQGVEEREMDMEEELESRMDADVRAKWATNFSGSTAVQGAAGKGRAKTGVVGSEYFPLIFFSSSHLGVFEHESWGYFWRANLVEAMALAEDGRDPKLRPSGISCFCPAVGESWTNPGPRRTRYIFLRASSKCMTRCMVGSAYE